jgi:hypothetical protein
MPFSPDGPRTGRPTRSDRERGTVSEDAIVPLRAGPLSAELIGMEIWNLRFAGTELLRRIYVAVRDRNWDTRAPRVIRRQVERRRGQFQVDIHAVHECDDISLTWAINISGTASGEFRFAIDGRATGEFLRSRIGLCLHHPVAGIAGRDCTIIHSDGSEEASSFPLLISPRQPFMDMRAVQMDCSGLNVGISLDGEEFETEDHRNWTDASFKTYAQPMRGGSPVIVHPGQQYQQAVSVTAIAGPSVAASDHRESEEGCASLLLTNGRSCQRPALGTILPENLPGSLEFARLRALHLDHIRLDLREPRGAWPDLLAGATRAANEIGSALEVAVHLGDDAPEQLACIAGLIREVRPPIRRWIVLRNGERATNPSWVLLARRYLMSTAPLAEFGTGTDEWFAQLNRARPDLEHIDFVSYPVSPFVHSKDDRTLFENLEGQAWTVTTARSFVASRGIVVSPITLLPRFNPLVKQPYLRAPGELDENVDPRQASLRAAVWTAATIKQFAEAGAASLTMFEAAGQRGLMAAMSQTTHPDFPAGPGDVYPLYHVLADIGGLHASSMLAIFSSDPQAVGGFGLIVPGGVRLLLFNLTPQRRPLSLSPLVSDARLRVLDDSNLVQSMRDPEGFRSSFSRLKVRNSTAKLELGPWAIARVDVVEAADDVRAARHRRASPSPRRAPP